MTTITPTRTTAAASIGSFCRQGRKRARKTRRCLGTWMVAPTTRSTNPTGARGCSTAWRRAIVARQLRDRALERCLQFAPLELRRRVDVGRETLERLVALARHATLAGGEAVQAEARGDRVEPRRELGLAAEILHGAMDPEENLLGDLLGLAPIAQHRQGHSEDPVLVGDHQLLEGSRVTPP